MYYSKDITTETHIEKKQTQLALVDLENAFDRVRHDLIWHALRSRKIVLMSLSINRLSVLNKVY